MAASAARVNSALRIVRRRSPSSARQIDQRIWYRTRSTACRRGEKLQRRRCAERKMIVSGWRPGATAPRRARRRTWLRWRRGGLRRGRRALRSPRSLTESRRRLCFGARGLPAALPAERRRRRSGLRLPAFGAAGVTAGIGAAGDAADGAAGVAGAGFASAAFGAAGVTAGTALPVPPWLRRTVAGAATFGFSIIAAAASTAWAAALSATAFPGANLRRGTRRHRARTFGGPARPRARA